MKYLRTPVLTKDDKIDLIDHMNKMEVTLISRLDKHTKSLTALIIVLFIVAIAFSKITQ